MKVVVLVASQLLLSHSPKLLKIKIALICDYNPKCVKSVQYRKLWKKKMILRSQIRTRLWQD